jgi:hypothetical protein
VISCERRAGGRSPGSQPGYELATERSALPIRLPNSTLIFQKAIVYTIHMRGGTIWTGMY